MVHSTDPIRKKKEAYYGTYAGNVTTRGAVMMSTSIGPDLFGGAKKVAHGDVTGGIKTALGKGQKEESKGTPHPFTLVVDESKVVATIDGKELSNCSYTVNDWGNKDSYRITADDMDFSAVIHELTQDGTKAQVLFIDLSSGLADGGEVARTGA